jgi:DNA-binding phage protein
MKKIAYINDPLITLLIKEFEYVEGFSNREKIATYLKDLIEQDIHLQFILDHFQCCEANERYLMTRESNTHFDSDGNLITEDELRTYLCQPLKVKLKLRDEQGALFPIER